jgi:hypothetical protein
MPNVAHASLSGADLHEPKGIASASSGMVYVADGASSGSWRYIPHSFCYYANIGTGTTYTAPTSYTLVNPTTIGDANQTNFTHNSAGRLTYTGSTTIDVTITCTLTAKHSASATDCFFQLYKSGSGIAGAEVVEEVNSSNYSGLTIVSHTSLATNQYVELYCKTASGNIVVHAMNLSVLGHI